MPEITPATDPPTPLTLDGRLAAGVALELLLAHGQAVAFVAADGGRTGVVDAEDLRFATDWAGPQATVAQAITQELVDLTDPMIAALARWRSRGFK